MNKFISKIAGLSIGLAMAIGVGVFAGNRETKAVEAADVTATWTATSGGLGSGIGSGTITDNKSNSWSYTRTLSSGSSYTGWTSNCIQLGKNGGVENLTLSTSAIAGTIKSVSVECASYQGRHNVSITVGSTTYLASTSTSSWTTVDTKTGTGTSTGAITIAFTGGTKAMYIKSFSVTYNNDAPVSKYSVTYKAGEGTGSDYVVSDISSGTNHTLLNYDDANLNYVAPQYHTFSGWSVVVGSAQAVTKSAGESFSVTADSVCTAIWTDNRTDVTLTATAEKNNLDINETASITVTSSVGDLSYTYLSSDDSVASVSGNVVTGVSVGSATITISFAGNESYKPASTTVDLTVYNSKAVEIDFVEKYGTTTTDVKDIDQIIDSINGTKVVFSKSSGTDPKYYSGGVRCYANNYFTVSSSSKQFSSITLTFGTGEGSNTITTDVDTYTEPTWSAGSATNISSVTFSIGGTSGNRRIKKISITYVETGPAVNITSTFTGLKYAGDSNVVTAEFINTTGEEGSLVFASSNGSVATINPSTGAVTAVGKGETTITVSDSNEIAQSASFTLRVVSAHKGDRLSDALTTEEAVDIYLLDTDHSINYYVTGLVKEIDTETYDDTDYFIDGTSSEDAFDFYGPTAGDGIALSTITVDRQITAYGTILEWPDEESQPTGTYGMDTPEIVYVNIGTLNSISISGSMTDTSYSSKESSWDLTGITVNASYQGEAEPIDITSDVSWSFNYASPAAVPLTCEKGESETKSLNITASFGGKTVSLASPTTVTITNDGYYIHTLTGGYNLVTSASELSVDDSVVIVADGSDYAMSTTQNSNNRARAAVTKEGSEVTWDSSSSVQEFILEAGSKDGTFAFYTGSGYIYAASSGSNYLRTKEIKDDNASFLITISNGSTSIVAQGTNSHNTIKYNSSSSVFSCYTSGQGAVSLYKKSGTYEVGDDLIGAVDSFEEDYTWDAQCASFNGANWGTGGANFTSALKTKYELNNVVANISGNKIEEFLAKYDYVIQKFGNDYDFLGRFSTGGINAGTRIVNPINNFFANSANTLSIVIVITLVCGASIGGYFYFRKKKEQ